MVTQTDITLGDGDVKKIINEYDANQKYIVEVIGDNPIRVAHRERYAPDGTTLTAGQSHSVSNLRGDELYAAAFNGPTSFRVREAAADVESQPEKEISITDGSVSVDPPSNSEYTTQTLTGSGTFDTKILDNPEVIYRADPSNESFVEIEGFPLNPGDGILLNVPDPGAVSVTASLSTDKTIALYGVE